MMTNIIKCLAFALIALILLSLGMIVGYPEVAFADHQVFISDATTLRVTDIATMGAVSDVAGVLSSSTGYDDGYHMVVDSIGRRIFVSDHDSDFMVFNFSLTQLFPTWGGSLSEPLGIAPLPDGRILITDEEDYGGLGQEGLFRLNSNLTLDASASGTSSGDFDGLEGVVYDSVNNRIFVADEDDGDIEIFNGTTLARIGNFDTGTGSDGPYWLGVDGSSNRLFMLSDYSVSGNFGIHVYDIISGGNNLSFNQTLLGSGGASTDCYGTLAVSESTDRLFAIDYCNDTVAIYDTTNLNFLGTVPVARAGTNPLMVSVGDFAAPTPGAPDEGITSGSVLRTPNPGVSPGAPAP
ncbi:MAG: hypothetical protein BMS9Abin21_042 [Thermodesulfovibrionia bacterium]|nr:MAG: hypothetical protein BMS9Abin21_042 [Thermodesulfovibrionia bacterium]